VKLSLIGPKKYYLALGDSEAFGFQPDLDFDHGYADDFFKNLKNHGVDGMANLGCNGETSSTFIKRGCLFSFLRKHTYHGPQLTAAIKYLKQHSGQVSPVTLDIGANDLVLDIDTKTCTVSSSFQTDLEALDINLTQTILPQLHAALTVNGQVTGDLLMMNYYDPYQNKCPNTLPYIQMLNQHLAIDINGSGTIVDVFSAFGGSDVPNNHICTYTWMCSVFKDYHPTDQGYSIIANAFEEVTGY
jgi:lysophospholipase L1-like esterase